MNTNPYQSPTTDSSAVPSTRVDGRALVVASGAVLPPRCVKTDQPVTEDDMIRRDFYWCSPLVALLILVSGCLVILAYFVFRKRCTLTYGLHPSLRKKYRKWVAFKVVAVIVLFFALPFSAATDSGPVIITVCVLFFVAIVALFVGNSPLSVANHRKGMFSIKGCSNEFLANLNVNSES